MQINKKCSTGSYNGSLHTVQRTVTDKVSHYMTPSNHFTLKTRYRKSVKDQVCFKHFTECRNRYTDIRYQFSKPEQRNIGSENINRY